MPQRLLRPTIRQSKRWNRVSYLGQSLYIRLVTLVDDFARYEADAELIRSEAFPYGDPDGNVIPVPSIDSELLSLASKDMLKLYSVDGKRYLQLTRWKERVRADESKYPDPSLQTNDVKSQQMIASPPQPQPQPQPQPVELVIPDKKFRPEEGQSKLMALKNLIGELFARKPEDAWSYMEETLLVEISKRPDCMVEFELLSRFKAKDSKYFPQSVEKILSGWTTIVDRARNQPKTNGQPKFRPAGNF